MVMFQDKATPFNKVILFALYCSITYKIENVFEPALALEKKPCRPL